MSQVYVVIHKNKKGAGAVAEVHADADSANAAAEALGNAEVKEMNIVQAAAAPKTKAKATAASKAKPTKKAAKPEPENDDMDLDDDDEDAAEEPAPAKKAAPKKAVNDKKKTIPEGKPDALEGLNIMFTGTFETMDRDTSKATAVKYGAKVVTTLAKTDYVVLGTKAGPKKLTEIEELGLDTLDEEGFFELLQNGIPQDKLDRMGEREPAAKKQKK